MNIDKSEEVRALFNELINSGSIHSFDFDPVVTSAGLKLGKERNLTTVFLKNKDQYIEWEKNYVSSLKEHFSSIQETETTNSTWNVEFNLDTEHKTAIAQLEIGDAMVLMVAPNTHNIQDPLVNQCIHTARQMSRKANLETIVKEKSPHFRQGILGPVIVSISLIVLGVLNILAGDISIYSINTVQVPGIAAGIILFLMAVLVFGRKIKLVFYFMLASAVWNVMSLTNTNQLGERQDLFELMFLVTLFFMASVLVLHRDFGLASIKDFVSRRK